MSNRDSIIDRIRKLRRMTEEAGASENEALMASAQIAKLVALYNIDESELRLRADAIGMVDDSYSMPGPVSHFHTLVCRPIARFTRTKLRWRTVEEDVFDLGTPEPWTYVKFYGYPLDVEASVALSAICQTSIVTESERWERANPMEKLSTRRRSAVEAWEQERRNRKLSFFYGMCERLGERIESFIPPPSTSTGTSLVLLKDELVEEHYRKHLDEKGLGLRVSPIADISLHPDAYRAGIDAGSRVDLGRNERVSAAPQHQRIA